MLCPFSMKKLIYTIEVELEAENIESGKQHLKDVLKFSKARRIEIKHEPQKRSLNQNSALHLYFEMVEQEAREKGLTMDMIIKKPNELPITRHLLKDLFRLIGKTMYKKESTADLTKEELSEVVETFQKIVAERLDVTIPFPSEDTLMNN